MYDPSLGRWNVLDPLAEKYFEYSPYNYCLNNPILYFDIDGRDVGAGIIIQNNSNQTVTLWGDGQQLRTNSDGTQTRVNGDASWENGNDDIRGGFSLAPGQSFKSATWTSTDDDGNLITHYGGEILNNEGELVRNVDINDVDYIDLDDNQKAEIDRWYGTEEVSPETHEEKTDGMFDGSGTTKGEIKLSVSGDKDDPVEAKLTVTNQGDKLIVDDEGVTRYDTDNK